MKRFVLVVAVNVLSLASSVAQTAPKEQTSFCDDDAPQELRLKPAALPGAVLKTLESTKEARGLRGSKVHGRPTNIATLFRGAEVDLGAAHDKTFLVIGEFPMSGADNTWFWIVRESSQKATILLWAGANCLSIRQSSSSGLKDIQTVWSSASYTITKTYAFDGIAYKLTTRKTRPGH